VADCSIHMLQQLKMLGRDSAESSTNIVDTVQESKQCFCIEIFFLLLSVLFFLLHLHDTYFVI